MLLIIAGGTPDGISLLFPMLDCVLIFPTAHEGCAGLQSCDHDVCLTQCYRERVLNALHRVAVMSGRWLSLAVCVSVCLSASLCGIHYHIPPQRPLQETACVSSPLATVITSVTDDSPIQSNNISIRSS